MTLTRLLDDVCSVSTLCLENDADVAHYNFDGDRPILIIFDR